MWEGKFALSDDRKLQQAELEEERRVRAQVHRWLGTLATVLVVVAIGVAVWTLDRSLKQSGLGISLWESLGMGFSALPWVLLIIGLGVVFSLGTTRTMLLLERVVQAVRKTLSKKKAGG